LGSFPSEISKQPLYTCSAVCNDSIYFAPFFDEKITRYKITEGCFETINYDNIKFKNHLPGEFAGAECYKDYVYLIPYMYKAIIRLNTKTMDIEYYTDWVKSIDKMIYRDETGYFSAPLKISENTLMLAALSTNAVIEFNMETADHILHRVGKKGCQFSGICFDGTNYWLSPRHYGPVLKWHPDRGVMKEFSNLSSGSKTNRFCFHAPFYCNGYVYIMPRSSKHAVKINVETDEVLACEEFMPEFTDGELRFSPDAYFYQQQIDNYIYLGDGKDGALIEYDCNTGLKRSKVIKLPQNVLKKTETLRKKQLEKDLNKCTKPLDFCHKEPITEDLSKLLNLLLSDNSYTNTLKKNQLELFENFISNANGTSGKVIYDYCKDLV